MESDFFRGGVYAPTFFGDAKFEVQKFSEFFHLQTTMDSEFLTGWEGLAKFLLVMPNLRPKFFFGIFSFKECPQFFRGGV